MRGVPKRVSDISGKRSGFLVAVKYLYTKNEKRYWLCSCDCGGFKVTHTTLINKERIKTCGCRLGTTDRLPACRRLATRYKIHARDLKLSYNLSFDDVTKITSSNCFYCNSEPSQKVDIDSNHGTFYIYNGIDRMDSSKGYETDNVLPCCKTCNYMKSTLTQDRFYKLVSDIVKTHPRIDNAIDAGELTC